MRTARVIVAIAPPAAYDVIAAVAGPDISPLFARIILGQIALGNVLPASATRTPGLQSDRDLDGPRFIQID
jgi:hypothetical protein